MTKIDWRLLLIVACAFVTAASAVVMAKHTNNRLVNLVEIIPPKGAAVSDIVSNGMQLELTAKGLTMTLPDCKLDQFQDKFFLHVYTKAGLEKTPAAYVNLDFALGHITPKEVKTAAGKACVYVKSFSDFSPQLVNVGQFTTPGGRCCEITWSRSWVFDEGPQARP